jgi:hypothetical protein
MAPSATGLVGVHGFDLARDAEVELQVLVCECVRNEVAQIVGSLIFVSGGAEHSGISADLSRLCHIDKGAAQRDRLARPEHCGTSYQVPWLH